MQKVSQLLVSRRAANGSRLDFIHVPAEIVDKMQSLRARDSNVSIINCSESATIVGGDFDLVNRSGVPLLRD